LDEFAITDFPTNSLGFTFRIQIEVTTTQHTALSDILFVIRAGVPSKPTDIPITDS